MKTGENRFQNDIQIENYRLQISSNHVASPFFQPIMSSQTQLPKPPLVHKAQKKVLSFKETIQLDSAKAFILISNVSKAANDLSLSTVNWYGTPISGNFGEMVFNRV